MRAGWYEKNGPARDVIQIGEIDTPVARPGEVRVQLYASGVNPSDVKTRAGLRNPMTYERIIPHSDGAGIVDQVGDGVDAEWMGRRVWVYNGQWGRQFGTAAEYITLPLAQIVPLPDEASFAEGACLGIPAMTAHRCLFADGTVGGKMVLVTGGAGAVGHYAIQLAKWDGATVITTVSSDEKAEAAQRAGADHVINYRTQDVIEHVLEITRGQQVDHIVEVDFGGNLAVTRAVLKVNGTVACYASMGNVEPEIPFYPLMFKNINIRLVLVYNMPDEAKEQACQDIVQAVEDEKLVHTVAAMFPLEQLAEAHESVEGGSHIGKIIVELAES